jgi:LuxR family maltose regulon positive regulatory protein
MVGQNSSRLTTKISSPIIRSLLVKRSHLVECLRSGMSRKVSLVIAPAGYGKTTLLGEWLASIARASWPVAWLTLDKDDNAPLRFWGYMADALVSVNPEWQFELSNIGEIAGDGIDHQLLISWINQINASPAHFSLILDDYHNIHLESIHKDLSYFITHMPQHLHLVIASRIKPKLPVAELRVKNQLVEINFEDLTFNASECEIFLREVMGLDLAPEEVVILARATEGWAAGLQMAALSIKNQPDASQWISNFSGRQSYIFDYLTEAVMDVQDEPVRDFLLRSSILKEISAPLCDAVLDCSNSIIMLDKLEHANLFIQPLDEERCWYRYHRLFSDVLQQRLEREQPTLISVLHQKACHWFDENGYPEKSIDHAISADNVDLIASMIQKYGRLASTRNEHYTLLSWLRKLPEEEVLVNPKLCLLCAFAHINIGYPEAGLPYLQTARDLLENQGTNDPDSVLGIAPIQIELEAFEAHTASLIGDHARAIDLSHETLKKLGEQDPFLSGTLLHILGESYERIGEFAAAERMQTQAKTAFQFHGSMPGAIFGMYGIGQLLHIQGRLRQAAEIYLKGWDIALKDGFENHSSAGLLHLGLGKLQLEWGDLARAQTNLTRAQTSLAKCQNLDFVIESNVTMVYLHLIQGDLTRAAGLVDQSVQLVQGRTIPRGIHFLVKLYQARIALIQGNLDDARLMLIDLNGKIPPEDIFYRLQLDLISARLLLAEKQPAQAESSLSEAYGRALKANLVGLQLSILTLKSVCLQEMSHTKAAVHSLLRAVGLAHSQGFKQVFLDEGSIVGFLLSKVLHDKEFQGLLSQLDFPQKIFISGLINAIIPEEPDRLKLEMSSLSAVPLVEPLSDRELEVLRLWVKGLSRRQIANYLVISIHTTKTHLKHIYSKLGVHDRAEAFWVVKELNLL